MPQKHPAKGKTTRLDPDAHKAVTRHSRATGISATKIASRLIDAALTMPEVLDDLRRTAKTHSELRKVKATLARLKAGGAR